ncbi:MAG TPA: metallophosphoesterase [Geobacteraceae bacterium]|nr:metallophosphoesterase [Geobacteraceae bacterium]
MIEVFHVSDLHFGQSVSRNRRAGHLLDAISRQFPFEGRDNRFLLVTGDITQNGRKSEYELALQALAPFAGRVFLTPGNHDYGSLLGTDYSVRKARYFDSPFAETLGFTHPFFNKKVFTRQLLDPSDHSALLVIGLNSCAREGIFDFAQGEVGAAQLAELDSIIAGADPKTPTLVFLHHIPDKEAEWDFVMTLRDWKELVTVVSGRVDVLAFGHQGTLMEVGRRGKAGAVPVQTRPMRARSLAPAVKRGGARDGKRALVLDADGSVPEQALYRITLDGGKPTVSVIAVAETG